MAFLRPTVIYKSPTIDSRFANLMVQSSDTKPVVGYPTDPKKNFDYSAFEPAEALKDFTQKKTEDSTSGRVQTISVDGVWGVLDQVVKDENGSTNSAPKQQSAVWQWTTFMKAGKVNNKIDVILVYPSPEMEHFKGLMAGIVNSIKIKRHP